MTLHVTRHAIERYQERVENLPTERVVELLNSEKIQQADDFGAHVVRLGGGQRVVLENHAVITVLPAERPLTIRNQRHAGAPRCHLPCAGAQSHRST